MGRKLDLPRHEGLREVRVIAQIQSALVRRSVDDMTMKPPKVPAPLPDVGIWRAGRSEARNEAGKAFGDKKPGQPQFVVAQIHQLSRRMEELVAAQLRMAGEHTIMLDLQGDDGVEILQADRSQVDEAWRIARVQ